MIQAHPFRMRGYMNRIRVGLEFCDGIEAANLGNEPIDDARAFRMGKAYGLVMTAGTDNHCSPVPAPFGVELEKRLTSIRDYVTIILNRERIILHVPESRFSVSEDGMPDDRHIAYNLDREEHDVLSPAQWMRDG